MSPQHSIILNNTKPYSTPRPTNFAYPGRWAPSLSSSRGSATNQTLKSDSKPFRGYKVVPHAANPAVKWVNELSTNLSQPDIKVVDGVSEEASKGIMAILTKPDSSQSSKSWLNDLDLFQVRQGSVHTFV